MRYLLDSDVLSDFYEQTAAGHKAIVSRILSLGPADSLAVSVLALYECEYGCARASPEKRGVIRGRIDDALRSFEVLPLSAVGSRLYGSLKARLVVARGLSKKGGKAHSIDLMLAATALAEGCTLVSGDGIFSELQKLDEALQVENWFSQA